jgi:hypothetical protein
MFYFGKDLQSFHTTKTLSRHSAPPELCIAANTTGFEVLILFACLGAAGQDE